MSPTAIAAYLALFSAVGFLFLLVNLLVGKFLRPHDPHAEKLEVYECGEPTIGSAFVQFDLRFYVVALLFIIFDVEVAFFFPWATVFGKATHVNDRHLPAVVAADDGSGTRVLNPQFEAIHSEMGIPSSALAVADANGKPVTDPAGQAKLLRENADKLARYSILDIGAFFAILMVGFAYVWRRGDLDWVRAVSQERQSAPRPSSADSASDEPALAV